MVGHAVAVALGRNPWRRTFVKDDATEQRRVQLARPACPISLRWPSCARRVSYLARKETSGAFSRLRAVSSVQVVIRIDPFVRVARPRAGVIRGTGGTRGILRRFRAGNHVEERDDLG